MVSDDVLSRHLLTASRHSPAKIQPESALMMEIFFQSCLCCCRRRGVGVGAVFQLSTASCCDKHIDLTGWYMGDGPNKVRS